MEQRFYRIGCHCPPTEEIQQIMLEIKQRLEMLERQLGELELEKKMWQSMYDELSQRLVE